MNNPIENSYQVSRNVFAGEHPLFNIYNRSAKGNVPVLLKFGITVFLDLTQSYEVPEYASFLPTDVRRISFPIRNCDIPSSIESVIGLFRELDKLFREYPQAKLYIHCHGGVGRTGTIVACFYIYFEHLSFEEALDKMRQQFAQSSRSKIMNAPENKRQIEFIKMFSEYNMITLVSTKKS